MKFKHQAQMLYTTNTEKEIIDQLLFMGKNMFMVKWNQWKI